MNCDRNCRPSSGESTSDLPLGVSFGIAQPQHAAAVVQIADGIIVVSALINTFDHAPTGDGVTAVASRREQASDSTCKQERT